MTFGSDLDSERLYCSRDTERTKLWRRDSVRVRDSFSASSVGVRGLRATGDTGDSGASSSRSVACSEMTSHACSVSRTAGGPR